MYKAHIYLVFSLKFKIIPDTTGLCVDMCVIFPVVLLIEGKGKGRVAPVYSH